MTHTNKQLDELDEPTELQIVFAPGCFDGFEGTQEELDEFVKEITRLVKSGEAQKMAVPIDLDDEDFEMFTDKRNLQ